MISYPPECQLQEARGTVLLYIPFSISNTPPGTQWVLNNCVQGQGIARKRVQHGSECSSHALPFPQLPRGELACGRGGVGWAPVFSLVQVSRSICQTELSFSPAVCQTEKKSQHPRALDPLSWLSFFGHGVGLLRSQDQVGEVNSESSG